MDCKVSVEEVGEVRRDIHIEIPRSLYNQRFDSALSRTASQAQMKGFRPGRVPRAMIVKMYGPQIHDDVVSTLVSEALHHTVHEHKLHIVGAPDFTVNDVEGDKDLKVTAGVSLLPTPKVKALGNKSVEVEVEQENDEDFQKQVDGLRERFASFVDVEDRTIAASGDFIEIDFSATVDGKPFSGSERQNAMVQLGAKRLPDALEEGLLGVTVGESKTIPVAFPEDLRDKTLAGKTADYQVTLKKILRQELPEVTDDFAKLTQLADTVDGFNQKIHDFIKAEFLAKNNQAKEKALFEKLISENTFEVPQVLIDEEIRSMLFEMNVLDPRNEQARNLDVSRFRETLGKQADYRVRYGIIVDSFIRQEEFTVDDTELENWLAETAKEGYPSREAFNKEVGYPKSKERLRHLLLRQRMAEQLVEKAKFKESIKDRSKSDPNEEIPE